MYTRTPRFSTAERARLVMVLRMRPRVGPNTRGRPIREVTKPGMTLKVHPPMSNAVSPASLPTLERPFTASVIALRSAVVAAAPPAIIKTNIARSAHPTPMALATRKNARASTTKYARRGIGMGLRLPNLASTSACASTPVAALSA